MEKCIVAGCNRKKETSIGACLMHYKRYKRYGSFELPKKQKPKKCKYCDRLAVARGMCNKHYQNWNRHGDPLYTDKIRKHNRETVRNKHGYLRDANGKWRHRNIAEKHFKRQLGKNEIVHHINVDKLDNRIENFYICSRKEHMYIHNNLEQIAGELFKKGVIGFKNGKYYICK